jgi:signal transduction histidine kinase
VIAVVAVDYLFRDSLKLRTETIAASISSDEVAAAITPNASDHNYRLLKIKLSRLKAIHEDAKYIYILHRDPIGLAVVADSESPGSMDYRAKGTHRPGLSLGVTAVLDNPKTIIETSTPSPTDRRLSAYAPITDTATGKTVALAAIDISVDTYYSLLTIGALVPLILSLAVSTIIVFLDRSRSRRLETLRFRSELVSIASHELRTPLTGIRWSEEVMLKDKQISAKTQDSVRQMYDSTLKLQESIEDILQLAGLQNQQIRHLKKLPTDITAMIQGIFTTQQLPASQQGIKLSFAHDWPKEVIVTCDAVRMRRVFNNIISNAIKYTRPNTEVIIGYEKVDGQHLITVKDQGIGIPKKDQEKVFSGFYRSENAIKFQANGTGMGLYLSRSVLEQHGGSMWLHSVLNKGTTVFMRLP